METPQHTAPGADLWCPQEFWAAETTEDWVIFEDWKGNYMPGPGPRSGRGASQLLFPTILSSQVIGLSAFQSHFFQFL